MRSYQLPKLVKALVFDMDNTLYTNADYANHQELVLVERLAREFSIPVAKAGDLVNSTRGQLSAEQGGKKPSLGTTFLKLGIPIATSVAWRNEFIIPERFLRADQKLAAVFKGLAINFRLAIVTNNPVATARRTLDVLGIGGLVPVIIGLDSTGVSKPDLAAFRMATELLDCPSAATVSVGDRYEIDIEPALALGMGGLLVDGVEDVYALPGFLIGKS